MIDDPVSHGKMLQINQKLQRLESFIQEWDAKKVGEIAQQRLSELQVLEKIYQTMTEEMAVKVKERERDLIHDKEVWDDEEQKLSIVHEDIGIEIKRLNFLILTLMVTVIFLGVEWVLVFFK